MRGVRTAIAALGAVTLAIVACVPSFDGLSGGPSESPLPDGDRDSSGGTSGIVLEAGGTSGTSGTSEDGGPSDAKPPPALPISCRDAYVRAFRTSDGDVVIDPDADGPGPSFTVYCEDITREAKSYLTLARTTDPKAADAFAQGSNISGWRMPAAPGGATSCSCTPDVVRAYTKVLLELGPPFVLRLDVPTYSKTNRDNDEPSPCEKATATCLAFADPANRYGTASSCVETAQSEPNYLGRGNVDLRGTPFHIATSQGGTTTGYATAGTTKYPLESDGRRKIAESVGGGSCGYQFPGNDSLRLVVELD
jgi:hypothetical protein